MAVRKVTRTVEEWYANCSRCGKETRVESGSVSVPSLCYECRCAEAEEKFQAAHAHLVGSVVVEVRSDGGAYPDLSGIRIRSTDGLLFDVDVSSGEEPILDVTEVKP